MRHIPRCQAAAVSIQAFLITARLFAATPGSFSWPSHCWAPCVTNLDHLKPFGDGLSNIIWLLGRIFVGIFRFQQRLCVPMRRKRWCRSSTFDTFDRQHTAVSSQSSPIQPARSVGEPRSPPIPRSHLGSSQGRQVIGMGKLKGKKGWREAHLYQPTVFHMSHSRTCSESDAWLLDPQVDMETLSGINASLETA